MVSWRLLLPVISIVALIVFEEKVSMPSCKVVPHNDLHEMPNPEGVKVMMVANLLLMGSDSGYMNLYFRDSFMGKFFRKSFEKVKPDMLIVLGDISAKGSELTNIKWLSVLLQFQRMLGPFLGLPLHIVLGDWDIGECSKMDLKLVDRVASSLPGLDSSGCGAFDFCNISFVSLNAVAMLCDNDLRFSVDKVIERESRDLQVHTDTKGPIEAKKWTESFNNFHWRENEVSAGSGPVLLLHFPLHRETGSSCGKSDSLKRNFWHDFRHDSSKNSENLALMSSNFLVEFPRGGLSGAESYEVLHTVPPNASEYILQALKPRIVFSAHTHHFCDHTHLDGTREVTVPAMTWDVRDDPGFVVATFGENKVVTVSQCSLARESYVLMTYASVMFLLLYTALVASRPFQRLLLV